MSYFTDYDGYLFGGGVHYNIYEKLGAHFIKQGKKSGVVFDVWAPRAKNVWVVGSFNDWEASDEYKMKRLGDIGVYELFLPALKEDELYKYKIETEAGEFLYKADPYAVYAEVRPGTASRLHRLKPFNWTDDEWMNSRETGDVQKKPMAIYEVHLGSWMRHFGYTYDTGFYTYREFAKRAIKYIKDMGYTHVELMGISEYPYDGSWGYQVTGYYAPTSRYGTPEDFKYIINQFHRNGIGVILDWVPAHFPRDAHGLADFDGAPLYEYEDPRMGEHPDWGTKIFNYGKYEVKNFLLGSALQWIEQYHIDGLRVDAVASMLYLDYGKRDGQWVPNKYGGNENLEAIEFFKHLNSMVIGRNRGAMIIAEESTAWPKVTGNVEDDGLGFTFKWNMGWMHDFLDYMKLDPYFRRDNHNKMTFAMEYNSSENYILVISHDEVVHLKCSMLGKMPGIGPDPYRNLKVGYAFMMGHPGKKLLFMGQEFAQEREWSEERELDWYLLEDPEHKGVWEFMRALLRLYRKTPALYENDNNWNSMEWIRPDDADRSIFTFVRKSEDGKNNLLFICNFTPMERNDYRVGVISSKTHKLVIDSDDPLFAGCGREHAKSYKPEKVLCDGREYSFAYELSPYGVAVFSF